ncbi:MAG: hypothetical protein KG003_02405 [Bacteroidetes bacterium]|nr:hypothetical protein [Bacteroidota bacterium]
MDQSGKFSPNARLAVVLRQKGSSWKKFFLGFITHPAYLIILISNISIFFLPGLDLRHNAHSFIYIYLFQSLLIGLVHIIKLNFYRFAPASRSTDWKNPHAISIFFAVHYGFFHFIYFFFIPPENLNWNVILYGTAINGTVIIYNSFRHYRQESDGHYNANDFMFLPYVRIVPIHIAVIIGGFLSALTGNFVAVFVVLAIIKTAMELLLEYIQTLGISFQSLSEIYPNKNE